MKTEDLLKNNKKEEKCSEIQSIQDINDKFDYEDEIPNGEGDPELVACGQDGNYNELQYIYEKKLAKHVTSGEITQQDALDALCLACHELETPRNRQDFYQYLTNKLGVTIS